MRRITFSIPWPLSAEETRDILAFAFQVALATYLGFYVLESIRPGFVSFYYNLDTFLWIAIITGALSSIWPTIVPAANKQPQKKTWKDFLWIAILGIGTVVVIWYKTSSIGWLVRIIAPLSGLIIVGLSLLVYYDRDESDRRE